MSKPQFVRIEGYTLRECYLEETGECTEYQYPVIGLYVHVDVDGFGFTERVLTAYGWVRSLEDSPTVSLQCPDGSFTDGLEQLWENKEEWVAYAVERQAERHAADKVMADKKAAGLKRMEGTMLPETWGKYEKHMGAAAAAEVLFASRGVRHIWELSEQGQADLNAWLISLGY